MAKLTSRTGSTASALSSRFSGWRRVGRFTSKKDKNNVDILKPEGFKKSTFSLLLATFAISLLSLGLPVMTLQVYDRILPNQGSGTLPVLIVGVCIAVVLETLLRLSRAYIIGRAGAAYEHRMACKAMEKVLHADLAQKVSYGIGEHLHRMSSVSKLKDFYNGYALTTLSELCFVPLFLGLIAYIAGWLVLVPSAILALFVCVSLWRGRRLKEALKRREKTDDKRFNFLVEALEGIHTLKAFALERFFERRYEILEQYSTEANHDVTQETSATFNSGAIFSHVMVAAVISFGAWSVLSGTLTTGGLIATLLLSGRIMQPIQKALVLWTRYQDYSLARKHVESILATPQQVITQEQLRKDTVSDGCLSLDHISFGFPNQEEPIIRDVSLELKRGDAVLISGAHGSGKTLLLNVIAGIYAPSKGEILVDGLPIQSFPPEMLTHHVGFIRTRPMIFRGTIRDNITCFGQIDEAQAREISALLNVDKEIAKLPGGFDTFVSGNNADTITPGLKQRISMIRVLATKPRLILFDNADRMLDKEGYAMIYSLLARLKKKVSMILISSDHNVCSLGDRHYVLEEGRLKEIKPEYRTGNIRPFKELRL